MPAFAAKFLAGRPAGVTSTTKDGAGLLIAWSENGYSMSVQRDGAGKPLQLTAKKGLSTYSLRYNYDGSGNFQGVSGEPIPTVFASELASDASGLAGGGGGGGGGLQAGDFKTVGGQQIVGAGDISVGSGGKAPLQLDGTAYDLNAVDHANRLLIFTSNSPVTLTIKTDATAGTAADDTFSAYQAGAGQVSFVADTANGVAVRQPQGTLAATSAQYRLAGTLRVGPNEHVYTESAGAAINGLEQLALNDWCGLFVGSNNQVDATAIGLRSGNSTVIDTSTAAGGTAVNSASEAATNKRRIKYTAAAAAAGRGAGRVEGATKLNPIDSGEYHNGRFPFTILGSIEDAAPLTGIAMIGGIANPPAGTLTTLAANPNGMIAIGFDEADANWQLFYRSAGSGAVTKIDLGADFSRAAGEVISLHVEEFTTGTAGTFRFVCTVRNLARKKVSYQTFTTTMPWSLDAVWFRGSATSTTQVALGMPGFVAGRVMA